ncbi:hypothetical protein Tco_0145386 [Tanacetum coccineum]
MPPKSAPMTQAAIRRYDQCNPTVFHGVKGAVKLRRWFEKTESIFEIIECAEGKKVKFAAATLEMEAIDFGGN